MAREANTGNQPPWPAAHIATCKIANEDQETDGRYSGLATSVLLYVAALAASRNVMHIEKKDPCLTMPPASQALQDKPHSGPAAAISNIFPI